MLLPRYGHDYLTKSRLDAVGITYISVCLIWTGLLLTGLAVFLQHRGVDFIRMRNPLLVSTSILLIHIYLCLVFLLYPLNASYGCDAGFWVMSLYFPLGIALWHTANIQLLNLSSVQEELMSGITCHSPRRGTSPKFSFAGWRSWLRRTSVVTKTSIAVAVCFGLQLIASLVIFLASRKFHASYGLFSHATDQVDCRKGWEWAITVIGQGLWVWIFGPILLLKISKINDVHRWRLQTTLAIVFSLPGMPVWLMAVYSPSFNKINPWWPPAMWFAPGLMTMEFVALFFPLLELYQRKKGAHYLQVGAANLEICENGDVVSRGSSFDGEVFQKPETRRIWSLERVLNSEEFLHFAATKDFTAENIIFLRRVRDWKRKFDLLRLGDGTLAVANKTTLFTEAASIFAETISLRTASYPVNIESKVYFALEQRFAAAARLSIQSLVAPFLDVEGKHWAVTEQEVENPEEDKDLPAIPASEPRLGSPVPGLIGFDEHVFDEAERSIIILVRTNTFPRYVSDLERTGSISALDFFRLSNRR